MRPSMRITETLAEEVAKNKMVEINSRGEKSGHFKTKR